LCQVTDYCGIVSGRDVDKFKETGLSPEPSTVIKTPSISECPLSLECRLKEVIHLGVHDLFLGEVVAVTADESVLNGDRIQVSNLNAISYMPPTSEYWSLNETMGRFGYSKKKMAK
jgi:flavin reductase (DIM6/NTAB) family NADH-FMN oxidoreductase RutF